MSKIDQLIQRREAVVPRAVARFAGTASAASAKGAIITTVDGDELIDFAGGIGVMNVGHCDDNVVRAIQEQAAQLTHACFHVATYEPYVQLCEKLVEQLPHGGRGEQTKAMLVNSGAEAVENAIKIARQATKRPAVICYTEGFHGRTLLCTTLTSKTGYKAGCGPFAPEVYRLPFPNFFRYGDGLSLDEFVERELRRLRMTFVNTVRAEDVAAIIIEVVQGEGGFCVAPERYLRGLREICDEHGIMLICDEVQSGFCRTGKWAAYEHFGITPDISTWAKSMGGGLPISAVIGKADVMDAAAPGTCGGTYGGNPIACAAAIATIRTMEEKNLNQRATEIGKTVFSRFQRIQSKTNWAVDARGLGAMQAIVFGENGDKHKYAPTMVRAALDGCLKRGVLAIPAGAAGSMIRILSPLVITDEQLERGLDILEEEILKAIAAHGGAKSERPAVAAR
jgi:4-aminobutyrate aminotransferase / (S)-3-amino-2-methylpropionate transaminase / 5-aminovalerate transaminase